jgi:hypothetical protein
MIEKLGEKGLTQPRDKVTTPYRKSALWVTVDIAIQKLPDDACKNLLDIVD